ncbi:MAG TPA: glycoside hydrolase family 2 TIM barrel-domain containing protein, partial [Polyangiaceae bacterium]
AGKAGGAGAGSDTGGSAGLGGAGTAGSAVAGSGGSGGSGGAPCAEEGILVEGRRLIVDCQPFFLRGVCWNPVPKGQTHPAGLDYAGAVAADAALMSAIGINVVRTYEPLTNTSVLDALHARGIYVLNGVYVYGGDAASVVTARVNMVKDHPAILGWVLGNEWNYNGLYVDVSHGDSLARLNEAAALIRAADATRPIITVYGEVPSAETVDAMPNVDVWGINAYRGLSFGDLFEVWETRSEKPMFIAEYGADAYNANSDAYDPESQATATAALTEEIVAHASTFSDTGVALGGTLFEWSDEWWKDQGGSPDAHDVGGIAPGGGPYPDMTFNEEWWGIVDVDRATRPAYEALGDVFAELPD